MIKLESKKKIESMAKLSSLEAGGFRPNGHQYNRKERKREKKERQVKPCSASCSFVHHHHHHHHCRVAATTEF